MASTPVRIEATAIGGGIAIARARVLTDGSAELPRYHIATSQAEAEIARLKAAMETVRIEMTTLAAQLPVDAPSEARALLDVHQLMLDDEMLCDGAHDRIRQDSINAEWALSAQADDLAEQFGVLGDSYLRERARDVQQVAERVLRALAGVGGRHVVGSSPGELTNDAFVVVSSDLAPADMLHLRHADAFVVGQGGVNSHTAILARSLDKPAVLGLGAALEEISDDDWLIVDGDEGVVLINPDESMLADYRERQQTDKQRRQALRALIGLPTRSRDGVALELHCNIELPHEAREAMDVGASGIGLFRSEFLFLNRSELPSEDEQFEAYRDAILAMQGRPVTIRTLDVGADKALPGQHRQAHGTYGVHAMANPSLSQRAIRYCLANPVLFLTQLRALLRASAFGPLSILIPMIAHPSEVEATKLCLARARGQLDESKQKYADHVNLGAMIEIPAAAITADWFAHHLDFLSIGTNDLVQYALAIDRDDPTVADLYDPWHPAVLSLINNTLEAGRRHGTSVTLCGEMAGQVEFSEVLLGLGLTSYSMHASSLLRVKEKLMSLDSGEAKLAAKHALNAMFS